MRHIQVSLALFPLALAGCAFGHPAGGSDHIHGEPGPLVLEPMGDEVRFIVLGDSQFNCPEVFERMIHEVELLRPHFVVQVGDLIHGYHNDIPRLYKEWERFLWQIAPLTAPYYPVPGNHDVITPESEAVYGEIWGQDRYFHSFDVGPLHTIILDTDYRGAGGQIEGDQLDWLRQDLADYAAANGGEGSEALAQRSIFVHMHQPIFHSREWDEMHALLRRYPVRFVFGGHTHNFSWAERDGITYVVVNSSGEQGRANRSAGSFFHFIHLSVVGGRDVRSAVIPAGSVLPIDNVSHAERRRIAPLRIPDRTLRIPNPEEVTVDETVHITLSNDGILPERTFLLAWNPRLDAGIRVEPERALVSVASGETVEVPFRVFIPEGTPRDALPRCLITTAETLRSGYVPREWEARYREDIERATTDPTVRVTNIPLDIPVDFQAEWGLFVPPEATATRREGEIVLDGILDDPAWDSAGPIADFHTAEGETPPNGIAVRFLWDNEHLYVGARMDEPRPGGLSTKANGDVPLVWGDDDFELFIDPGLSQSRFWRLFQNSAGTRFTSRPLYTEGNVYQGLYESGVHVGEDHWSLEYKIPWAEFRWEPLGLSGQAPQAGDSWGMNVWSHRQQSFEPRRQWSVMGIFPYEPDRFGVLRFE
jgi:hypothetical protein